MTPMRPKGRPSIAGGRRLRYVKLTKSTMMVRAWIEADGRLIEKIDFSLHDLLEDANLSNEEARRLLNRHINRFETPPDVVRREFAAYWTAKRRWAFAARHNLRCTYCQREGTEMRGPDGRTWTIDHRVPVSRGGGNEEEDLTLACMSCNAGKGSSLLEEEAS